MMFLLLLLLFDKGIGNQKLLLLNCLKKKIIAYVKFESFNLNAMTNAFKFVVTCCETLGLEEIFQGIALAMLFFKAC
jgi:hypothetical protein